MRFVAGLGAVAKRLVRGAAVAKRHQEDANQHRGATAIGSASAKRHREDAARREMRQCEAPSGRRCPQGDALRRRIGKTLHAGRCAVAKRHRKDAARRELHQEAASGSSIGKQHREATPPRKAAGKGAAAGFDF